MTRTYMRTAALVFAIAIGLGGCSSALVGPFEARPNQKDSRPVMAYPLDVCADVKSQKPCVLRVKGLIEGDDKGPGQRVGPIPLTAGGTYDNELAAQLFGHELKDGAWKKDSRPRFGVALAGGGSKASAFSMGVLAGLAESKYLQKADYVSTVSGGGYAGLFLYRYLIDQGRSGTRAEQIRDAFDDCIPDKYGFYFGDLPIGGRSTDNSDPRLCPDLLDLNVRKGTNPQLPVRYQQDVLSSRYDLGKRNWLEGTGSIAYQLGSTLLWLPPHHIGNSLFDWNADTSPTRSAYRRGIFKTYGAPTENCRRRYTDGFAFWRDLECVNSPEVSLRFKALREIYETKDDKANAIPYWIINGTSGFKGTFFGSLFEPLTNWGNEDKVDSGRNFFRDSFEMTVHGFGSGEYGYTRFVEPPLNLPNATAAAAAFFDSQERNAKGPLRSLAAAVQTALGLNWGMDIDNPLVSDGARAVHRALPWPFYRAYRFTRGRDSVDIHISDGGQSENLGLYALLRRGVRHIVIADAAYDGRGDMSDVCFIRNRLLHYSKNDNKKKLLLDAHNGQRLHIRFPGLKDFDEICESQWSGVIKKKDRKTYDLWDWKNRVVEGCVVISASEEGSNEGCNPENQKILSRLYLVKPALDKRNLFKTTSNRCTLRDVHEFRKARQESPDAAKPECMGDSTPWELAGFLTDKVKDPAKNPCPKFPQDTTVFLTINSDPFHYGAYRELGRVSSGIIKVTEEGDSVEPVPNEIQRSRPAGNKVPPPKTCM